MIIDSHQFGADESLSAKLISPADIRRSLDEIRVTRRQIESKQKPRTKANVKQNQSKPNLTSCAAVGKQSESAVIN